RSSLGISIPTVVLPGMTSTTRTLITASDRARSFARLEILLTLTPGAGWISKRVMTGPGWTFSTSASTPKSFNLISSRRDMLSSDSGEKPLLSLLGGSSSAIGGSEPGSTGPALKGTAFSLGGRTLAGAGWLPSGSIFGAGRFSWAGAVLLGAATG